MCIRDRLHCSSRTIVSAAVRLWVWHSWAPSSPRAPHRCKVSCTRVACAVVSRTAPFGNRATSTTIHSSNYFIKLRSAFSPVRQRHFHVFRAQSPNPRSSSFPLRTTSPAVRVAPTAPKEQHNSSCSFCFLIHGVTRFLQFIFLTRTSAIATCIHQQHTNYQPPLRRLATTLFQPRCVMRFCLSHSQQ